jgi:hypothetical protein
LGNKKGTLGRGAFLNSAANHTQSSSKLLLYQLLLFPMLCFAATGARFHVGAIGLEQSLFSNTFNAIVDLQGFADMMPRLHRSAA